MDEQAYLKRICDLVCNVFDAYSCVIFLPTSSGETGGIDDEYTLAASFSLGDNVLPHCRLKAGQGLAGWVLRNRQPLLVNNFDRQTDCLGYYNAEGESKIKAFLGCPMETGRGAICIDSKKTYSFSDRDQKILSQFAELIDSLQTGIANAAKANRERRYYECLNRIHSLRKNHPRWSDFLNNFLSILSESTSFHLCLFAARDEWGQEYFLEGWNTSPFPMDRPVERRYPMGSGLIGWVFKNHTPVFSGTGEDGPGDIPIFGKENDGLVVKSVVCLPLLVHKKTRGVLVLTDERNLVIDDEMRCFLALVEGFLSHFLENLYLKNKMRQKAADSSS